ncbi:MAG: hypothetical protein ACAI44_40275 [Candidatus Sericytochromatia bacterium]
MSNRRFNALAGLATEVAGRMAADPQEQACAGKLASLTDDVIPGGDVDFQALFPEQTEQVFLAKVFQALAHQVFLRAIGNQDDLSWQVSFICDAMTLSRLLQTATQHTLAFSDTFLAP